MLEKTGTVKQALYNGSVLPEKLKSDYGAVLPKIHYMPIVELDGVAAAGIISYFQKEIKPVAFELLFKSDTLAILSDLKKIAQGGSRLILFGLL